MTRILRIVAILGLATVLSGCDRCGNLLELDMFLQPVKKVCTGSKPAG